MLKDSAKEGMPMRKPKKSEIPAAMRKEPDSEPNVKVFADKKASKHNDEPVKMHGSMSRKRMDRPGRRLGGAVGADRSPLSTASKCE